LLAEANQDLISLFHCIKNEHKYFIDYCRQFFSDSNNQATHYYELRERFNHSQNPQERAAIFLYLNRHGYNGLCRYNQKGIYNVPFGRFTKPYFPQAELDFFYEKSKLATFIHKDFQETFQLARAGDLIYCDPPYSPLTQSSNFSAYTQKKFGEKEQIILAMLAKDAASRGITVIISNHDTDFTRHHYQGATIKSFEVKRSISCRAKQRLPVKELLAIFRG
jgi:DNA adenine methylase